MHRFSADQSKAIIANVKTHLGPDFTITHLGQAAVVATVLKLNPPGPDVPESQAHVAFASFNGRRYLDDQYSTGNKPFYPVCISTTPILFEDIKSYDFLKADRSEINALLTRASSVAKSSYDFWIKQPCQLPLSMSISNLIAYFMVW